MVKAVFLFLLLTNSLFHFSQSPPSFIWVSGNDITNQQGVYGSKGVSNSANIPGARENSVSWVDNNNDLWLFGGHGLAKNSTEGYLNDLWKYSPSTNQWTWISGNDSINKRGVYGTISVSNANNFPGARQNSVTWKDNAGNLWLFGGEGYGLGAFGGFLNDLWKYDIASNQWTWISGANTTGQSSNYGTLGLPSAANVPSARFGSTAWFLSDNLFLFGGQQNTAGTQERVNDLWKYNIASNQWTWVSGSNQVDQNGIYGTKGTANVSNTPGARQASVSWTDKNFNFWLFAGYGFPANGAHSYLDDLWKYDPNTNEWTWVSGTDTVNQAAVYGTKGIASASNLPGARQMSVSWTDNAGNLWLFGAWGYIGPPFGRINDLWKFDLSNNQWTWVSGANSVNQAGDYGSKGVASSSNIAGARRMSVAWKDNAGDFWFFGGNGYDKRDSLGLLNDLWQIDASSLNALDEIDGANFQLTSFPNPVKSKLNIRFSNESKHDFVISDYSGRIVFRGVCYLQTEIDLTEFPSGIYFIQAEDKRIKLVKI